MKKTIIAPLFVILALYSGCHYVIYGSVTSNCIYSENKIPIPEQISNGTLTVAKEAHVIIGNGPNERSCLKKLTAIDRVIVNGPHRTVPLLSKYSYVERNGLAAEPIEIGTEFRITSMLATKKRGLSTIDSGIHQIIYLILEDKNGLKYKISTSGLGGKSNTLFLTYSEPGRPHSMLLGSYYFDYAGKFVTAPESDDDWQPVIEWMSP